VLPGGSIHGVLGENGAGKSTLVRAVAGAVVPDGGTIRVDGRALVPGAPRDACAAGVGVVYQHFALIGALSVAENLALGRSEALPRLVTPGRLEAEAEALAARHGFAIGDPSRPCARLPVGVLARVEILRALSVTPRVLLLDEPTAVLTPSEIDELFAVLRALRDGGMLVIFVTHKLDEALALCDTLSVMRGGRLLTTVAAAGLSAAELARLMVGDEGHAGAASPTRAAETSALPSAIPASLPALAVEAMTTVPARGRLALAPMTFAVGAGEICGVAGVDGNGQGELAEALYGLVPRGGTVRVAGTLLRAGDVKAAQRAGIGLVPGDRQRDGLALGLRLWENAVLAAPLLARHTRGKLLDVRAARAFATRLVAEYRVVTGDVEQAVATLSGGNQQRLVIGRTLAQAPRVLVAVNPTRGLDIAATVQVHGVLRRAAQTGAAVLLISTDLDELRALCTRVFVLYRGTLLGPVGADERERLGALMTGIAA
jgi:simple sugar transport system ATP-binding protein